MGLDVHRILCTESTERKNAIFTGLRDNFARALFDALFYDLRAFKRITIRVSPGNLIKQAGSG
jgi:hypothetical protein